MPEIDSQGRRSLAAFTIAASVILVGIGSHSVASIKPVVIGAYLHQVGLASDRAGYLLAVEMIASSIGTTLVACLSGWTRGRTVLFAALAVAFIADLASAAIYTDFQALLAARFVAGMGEGIGLGRLAIAIATFSQPDRIAGCYSVATAAFAAFGAVGVPAMQASLGSGTLFLFLAGMVVPGLTLLDWFPTSIPNTGDKDHVTRAQFRTRMALGLGLVLYYLAIGAYWPFVGVIGTEAGLSYEETSRSLGWAGIAMVVGSCLSIATGHGRYASWLMVVLFLLGLAGVVVPMAHAPSALMFTGSACLFAFSWFALFPFLLGLMSRLDPSGQMNGFLYVIAAAAFAIGPGIAGWLVGGTHRHSGILHLELTVLVLLCGGLTIIAGFPLLHSRHERAFLGDTA